MQLIIVESPTKAKTLSRFLGSGFEILATTGHIKDLPKSKLAVDIDHNFKPLYEVVEKRKETIEAITKAAKKAKVVFLATDPDREGEAIAAHVSEILGHKGAKIHRIVFHEITKEAVETALKDPKKVDQDLVNAQVARRVLDRLVGYKLSPLLWRKVRRGLSAGRVQTVAVRLIVEREKEIQAFKKAEYWEIFCRVKKDKSFLVQLVKVADKKAEIKNKVEADKIVTELKKAGYKVLEVKKKTVVKRPFPPYTTSTLTQAAARLFAWSAKRTMRVAQGLYEEGLITYHRTDSVNLAGSAVAKARLFIKKNYGDQYLPEKANYFKTSSKSAQEAHEAIRPTNVSHQPSTISHQRDAARLYDLIWKRFVACQMTPAIYDETVIEVEATISHRPSTINHYLLRASGQTMKFDGWTRLRQGSAGQGKLYGVGELPSVAKDDLLQLIEVLPEQKFTLPPARYTEASLIKTLEKLGIGRPSTYAPIISTIQVRQYVEKEEGKFLATPVGVAVNDYLVPNFGEIFDYQFTAGMEEGLDKIAAGEKEWQKEIGSFYRPFEETLEIVEKGSKRVKIETEKLGRQCPECASTGSAQVGELVIRLGRFGKFISCSRFPDCKYTEKFIEKTGFKCPDCTSTGSAQVGDVIIKKSRRGRKFFGCSRYPDCHWASWRKPIKEEKNK